MHFVGQGGRCPECQMPLPEHRRSCSRWKSPKPSLLRRLVSRGGKRVEIVTPVRETRG